MPNEAEGFRSNSSDEHLQGSIVPAARAPRPIDPVAGAVMVVVEAEAIVGSALLVPPSAEPPPGRVPPPYPEIRLVAVLPQLRRRGVATQLLQACVERTRAEGYDAVGLHSTEYMADAIRIYERAGFVRAHEHDFQTPAGVLVMGFRLSLHRALDTSRVTARR
jgi:GNAT superfamily N-acetyltransferase